MCSHVHVPVDFEEMVRQARSDKPIIAHPKPFTEIPAPITETKPGQITEAQIRQYFDQV